MVLGLHSARPTQITYAAVERRMPSHVIATAKNVTSVTQVYQAVFPRPLRSLTKMRTSARVLVKSAPLLELMVWAAVVLSMVLDLHSARPTQTTCAAVEL